MSRSPGSRIFSFEPAPELMPVGVLMDLLVAGGIHALHAVPISEYMLGTVVVGCRSSGDVAFIALNLNPRRKLDLSPGAALLRIMAERVVEGVACRRVDVLARQDREARLLADTERDEAQAGNCRVAERIWRCVRPV